MGISQGTKPLRSSQQAVHDLRRTNANRLRMQKGAHIRHDEVAQESHLQSGAVGGNAQQLTARI